MKNDTIAEPMRAKRRRAALAGLLTLVLSACSGTGTRVSTESRDSAGETATGDLELGPTTQSTIDACMSQADMRMLSRINEARSQARQCGGSRYQAAPAVGWDCTLEQVARGHSEDMARNNFLDHTGSDGLGVDNRVTDAGYPWRRVAENVYGGAETAAAAVDGWLASSGHCANLMNPDVTETGMAGAYDAASDYGHYWTQVLATPR